MELQGDGFILRGWLLTDLQSLQRNADNKNISRFLLDRFPSPYTLNDAEAWVLRWKNQLPVVNFAIIIADEVAGGIGLDFRQDVYRKTPVLGYWLAEQHWGKGLMPKAVKLIIGYAFANLEVMTIVAYVLGNNPKSMQVLQKCGFAKQGIIRNSVIKNGKVLDEHVYGITSPSI